MPIAFGEGPKPSRPIERLDSKTAEAAGVTGDYPVAKGMTRVVTGSRRATAIGE